MADRQRSNTPPPIYSVTATALASTRARCWNASQLSILDMAIAAISDDLSESQPRFDAERFKTLARYGQGRVIPDSY